MQTNETSKFDAVTILQHLPHRYPFLLVDRITAIESGKSLHAIKNVSINEPQFCGHFPGNPVMPGVLLIEALAQACGILVFITENKQPDENSLYYLAGVDKARFKKVVIPGDSVLLKVELLRNKKDIWKFNAEALVNDELVCSAELTTVKKGK